MVKVSTASPGRCSASEPRTIWLSSTARAVIDAIPRYSDDCPFVFPAGPATRHIGNFEAQWHRILNEAGLPGLRIHDLRHNWASTAAMNGVDMVTVAKLLGHALVETEACPPCRRAPGRSGGEGRSLHRRRRWYGTAARRSAIEAPALRPLRQELSAPQARRAPGQWSKAAPLCGALDNVFMPKS